MVTLNINVADFGAVSQPGDRVIFYAPNFRTSADGQRVVSTAPRQVYLVDGVATVENVEPGPLMVEFACRNIVDSGPFRVVVPEGNSTVTLHSLLAESYNYEPEFLSEATALLRAAAAIELEMAKEADRAEAAADRIGTAEQVGAWVDSAKTSADNAKASQTAAKASETAAKASETAAKASQTAAAGSATDSKTSADAAEQSANRAGQIANSTSWNGDVLTVNGKSSPALTGPKGDTGPPGPTTWAGITDKPDFALTGHTHEIADVNGLQAALDAASSSSGGGGMSTTEGRTLQSGRTFPVPYCESQVFVPAFTYMEIGDTIEVDVTPAAEEMKKRRPYDPHSFFTHQHVWVPKDGVEEPESAADFDVKVVPVAGDVKDGKIAIPYPDGGMCIGGFTVFLDQP